VAVATPTRDRVSAAAVLMGLPGIVALFLGGLYALGAMLTMADLRGAGLRVRDALPMIPLEELLSRGIGIAVAAGVALLALMAFAACWQGFYSAESGSRPQALWWVAGNVLLYCSLALALYALPVVLGAALVLAYLALFVFNTWLPTNPRLDLAVAYVVVLAGFALHAFVAPRPLPVASLKLEGGTAVSGPLVSMSGGRWRVEHDRGGIEVVSDDQVVSARITSTAGGSLHQDIRHLIAVPWWVPAIVLVGLAAVLVLPQRQGFVTALRSAGREPGDDDGHSDA
jgi:hypothetical protein